MNVEDIKDFIRNRALRYAGSCSSQGSMEFNILNELYFDLFGEPAVNTIPQYDNLAIKIHHIENGHEYVDLGLPSGTLWATCNIGATKPEEYGDYFAWGEIYPKKVYEWNTYKHASGRYNQLTKYCDSKVHGKKGFTDDKCILEPDDDAAHVNWGGNWYMPTSEQQEEIINECYWVWTNNYNNSDVKGWIAYKAKSVSDKGIKIYNDEDKSSSYTLYEDHIFLPASGSRRNDDIFHNESYGNYWSSSRDRDISSDACKLFLYSNNVYCTDECSRYMGCTIRPVLNQKS